MSKKIFLTCFFLLLVFGFHAINSSEPKKRKAEVGGQAQESKKRKVEVQPQTGKKTESEEEEKGPTSREEFLKTLETDKSYVSRIVKQIDKINSRDLIIKNIQRDHTRKRDYKDNRDSYFYAQTADQINRLIDYVLENFSNHTVDDRGTIALFVKYRGESKDVVPGDYLDRKAIGVYDPRNKNEPTDYYSICIATKSMKNITDARAGALLTGYPTYSNISSLHCK